MKIYKPNNTNYWYITIQDRNYKRIRKSLKTKNKKIAEARANELEYKKLHNEFDLSLLSNNRITLEEFIQKYLKHIRTNASKNYYLGVERSFRKLTEFLGKDKRLSKITARDIEEYKLNRLEDVK